MEDEEFFGSLRNCEWLKLFGCDGEFYRWTHNFLGGEEFSGHTQRFFSVLREFVRREIFGLIENDFLLGKKLSFQMKVLGYLKTSSASLKTLMQW